MDYIKKLQLIGFSEFEAKVYLACLELGVAKVSELSTKTEIPRTSIYVYLKTLIEKGYIKKTKRQNVQCFVAIEPKNLFDDLQDKMNNFSKALPGLNKLIGLPKKKPKIEYFDTKEGMKKLYEIFSKSRKHPLYAIESSAATKHYCQKLGWDFIYKGQKKLFKNKVIVQGIITDSNLDYLKTIPENVRLFLNKRPITTRSIDDKKFPFSIALYLFYPNLTSILVPQDSFMVNIENKEIYQSLVTLFMLLYDQGKKVDFKELV